MEAENTPVPTPPSSNMLLRAVFIVLILISAAFLILRFAIGQQISPKEEEQENEISPDSEINQKKLEEGLAYALYSLQHGNTYLFEEAKISLIGMAAANKRIVERSVVDLLKTTDKPKIIAATIFILGNIHYSGSTDIINKYFNDDNSNVRAMVAYFYSESKRKKNMPDFEKFYEKEKELFVKIHYASAIAIANNQTEGKYCDFLFEIANNKIGINDGMRREATAALTRTLPSKIAVPQLQKIIYNYYLSKGVRSFAVSQLSSYPTNESMFLLFRIIENRDPNQKLPQDIVDTSYESLSSLLDNPDKNMRELAESAFNHAKRAMPHVLEMISNVGPAKRKDPDMYINTDEWEVEWDINAEQLAREINQFDDALLLADGFNILKVAKIQATEDLEFAALKDIDFLLKSKSTSMRSAGARLTGELPQKDAYKTALKAADDTDDTVRVNAILALGKLSKEHTLPYLQKAWQNEKSLRIKIATASSLARHEKDKNEYIDFLSKIGKSENPGDFGTDKSEIIDRARAEAIIGIGFSENKNGIPILEEIIFNQKYPRFLRRVAIVSMAQIVEKESAVVLLKVIKDLDLPHDFPLIAFKSIMFGFHSDSRGKEIFGAAAREDAKGNSAFKRLREATPDDI